MNNFSIRLVWGLAMCAALLLAFQPQSDRERLGVDLNPDQLSGVWDLTSTVEYDYSAAGDLLKKTEIFNIGPIISGPDSIVELMDYDGNGNCVLHIQKSYENDTCNIIWTQTYAYSAEHQVREKRESYWSNWLDGAPDTNLTLYVYDEGGREVLRERKILSGGDTLNSARTYSSYLESGLYAGSWSERGNCSDGWFPYIRDSVTYDEEGRVIMQDEVYNDGGIWDSQPQRTWTYDEDGRLTEAVLGTFSIKWDYSLGQNMIRRYINARYETFADLAFSTDRETVYLDDQERPITLVSEYLHEEEWVKGLQLDWVYDETGRLVTEMIPVLYSVWDNVSCLPHPQEWFQPRFENDDLNYYRYHDLLERRDYSYDEAGRVTNESFYHTHIYKMITSVENTVPTPKSLTLKQNYPNPFNASTRIEYSLPQPSEVQVSIYDLRGQRVKYWSLSLQPEGLHSLRWDGLNDHQQGLSSGVYLLRVTAGTFTAAKKMLLLK